MIKCFENLEFELTIVTFAVAEGTSITIFIFNLLVHSFLAKTFERGNFLVF